MMRAADASEPSDGSDHKHQLDVCQIVSNQTFVKARSRKILPYRALPVFSSGCLSCCIW